MRTFSCIGRPISLEYVHGFKFRSSKNKLHGRYSEQGYHDTLVYERDYYDIDIYRIKVTHMQQS